MPKTTWQNYPNQGWWGGSTPPQRKQFRPAELWQSAIYAEAINRKPPLPNSPDATESSSTVVYLPDSIRTHIFAYLYLPPLPLDGGWGKEQKHITQYKLQYQLRQHYLVWPHPAGWDKFMKPPRLIEQERIKQLAPRRTYPAGWEDVSSAPLPSKQGWNWQTWATSHIKYIITISSL